METKELIKMTITVEDLIEILSKYPPTMKIGLTGIEGGFYNATYIDEMELVLDYNAKGTARGAHEDIDYVELMCEDEDDLSNYDTETYLIIK